MTQAEPIHVAFLGVSSHAEEHLLPCIMMNRGYRLHCVASRDEVKARRVQEAFGFNKCISNWRDAIAINGIGAAFVAAQPSFHHEVATACLRRDIPIFIEKPSAPSLELLGDLVDLARAHPNTPTFVGYNFRHAPSFEKLLSAATPSDPCRAVAIRYLTNKPTRPFWHYPSILETFLYAIGIHALEMGIRIAGEPTELNAQYQPLNEKRFALQVAFRGSSGCTVSVEFGNYMPTFTAECTLIMASGRRAVLNMARPAGLNITDVDRRGCQQYQVHIPRSPSDRDGLGYQTEIESFRQAVIRAHPSSSPIEADLEIFRLIRSILELV